ncbi:MAG TPA: hypothetical protein PLS49_04445 [Candidatus Woesebacteria bacterium]|nr:hypothetical protein [Candidatus Woesebacteria bacterium]
MLKEAIYTSIFLFFIVFIVTAYSVNAVTIPTFPSCLNPQGELKVQYSNGTHGVPGDTTTYVGHDTVYKLTENTFTQCLCPQNGNAIQTNWWNVKNVEQEEIDSLVSQGWIFVPSGSVWGLEEDPYLAKNMKYSCIGGKGGGGSNSSNSNSSDSNNSSSSEGQGGGETSSAYTQVLSLASTGNIITVYLLLITGISLLISGIYIQRSYPTIHE